MRLLRTIFGYETENIPNIPFHVMSFFLSMRDVFAPVSKRVDGFGIKNGSVVVDFGCGPGSYIERASRAVGDAGKAYAVDANSYFARPGPRVLDGLELLATLIQPEHFDWLGPSDAYQPLSSDDIATPSLVAYS